MSILSLLYVRINTFAINAQLNLNSGLTVSIIMAIHAKLAHCLASHRKASACVITSLAIDLRPVWALSAEAFKDLYVGMSDQMFDFQKGKFMNQNKFSFITRGSIKFPIK